MAWDDTPVNAECLPCQERTALKAEARAAALWEALEALSVLSDECTPEEFAVLVKADRAIRRLRSRGKGGEEK
jgi:hypothetical protein